MAKVLLKDASVEFPVYSSSSLRSAIGFMLRSPLQHFSSPKSVTALQSVTITLNDGDRVGLIGLNGSGKSTFLRLLAGIYSPTSGTVNVDGTITTLFDLSLGMDDEATGYDNMYIAGAILGLSRLKVSNMIPDIESFTELGEALDRPIKTYSAGMKVRLAFGMVTNAHSEIMLIDEIVGVGDMKFLDKASKRVKAASEHSKILLLASHAEFVLKDFCDTGLVFSEGKIVKYGLIDEAIEYYNSNICKG